MRGLRAWGPLALWAALMAAVSSLPNLHNPQDFPSAHLVYHCIAYAVLTVLIHRTLSLQGWHPPQQLLLAAGALLLLGAGDEFHQYLVPGRSVSLGDFLCDAGGIMAGTLLARARFKRGAGAAHDPPPAGGAATAGTTNAK